MADNSAGFSPIYEELLARFAGTTRERAGGYGKAGEGVREELVRCIWFGGHLPREDLTLDDGRRMEIVSPGWWNVEGGPDFLRAEILLEGEGRTVGDVEVHTHASGWRAHGHHEQPTYNDVILHVTMWSAPDSDHVLAEDGTEIPQLTLSRVLDDDLAELVELLDPEDTPVEEHHAPSGKYCSAALASGELDPDWLGRLLDAAGDHRMLTRARTFTRLFGQQSREQLLYERIADALGFKNNRMPFVQLAASLPLSALRRAVPEDTSLHERAMVLEGAMFGASGLMDDLPADLDPETGDYVQALEQSWRALPEELKEYRLSSDHWQLGGTRPVNYPTRRIAALARLYARHLHGGLFGHLAGALHSASPAPRQRMDVALRNALLEVFTDLAHPYWSHHYNFGGRRLGDPKALVGKQRATAILVDVLLPLLLAHAEDTEDAELLKRIHTLWSGLPRRTGNTVIRKMQQAMFPSKEEARALVDSTRRQQGLHQLYRDACRTDDGCVRCVLHLAHKAAHPIA